MRRWVAAVLCCVLLLCTAVAGAEPEEAADAEPKEAAAGWDDGDFLTPGIFSIDGAYTQEGMNAPYESGYAPEVEGDELHVVLPLEASKPIDGDIIYCNLDLGDRDKSPFVYNNYQSIPVRPKYPAEEGQQVDSLLYVASLTLPLKADRSDGVYPLAVEIRYRSGQEEKTQVFTIDFTISGSEPGGEPSDEPGGDEPGGSDPGYDPGGSDPGYDPGVSDPGGGIGGGGGGGGGGDATPSEPKVILQSATAAPDPADAGSAFTVTCTLHNTSKKQKVSNMTVSYKSQTTDLIPLDGANTQYIESIGPNKTVQFAFRMESRLDAASGPQKIDLALAYEGQNGTAYTAADEITVQIRQKLRLEYDQPSFPTAVYIGDSINATLNLYNKGKGTLYNVTVSLDVPGIEPESSSFVGNMESGISKSADIYGTVVGLPTEIVEENEEGSSAMDETGEDTTAAPGVMEDAAMAEAAVNVAMEEGVAIADVGGMNGAGMGEAAGSGETEGMFLITYEDEFGDMYEERVPVSTMIMAMEIYDEPMEEPIDIEPAPTFPWWGWALIGGGGAAAVAIPVVRSRKKKRAQELEAEIEDDELY